VVEGDAGAHGDAFEGVVGDVAGDADLLGDEAVEVAEERGDGPRMGVWLREGP